MGREYRELISDDGIQTTSPEMRLWCQRPGKIDEEGNIEYTTEQHHKKECDVNQIIRKYDKTGLILHVSKFEAKYGNLTGLDFQNMMNTITHAQSMFQQLPSEIRNRFKNDPGALIQFMENPDNRDEAIKLGLINANWTPETDGLGEHVNEGGNILQGEPPPETPPEEPEA